MRHLKRVVLPAVLILAGCQASTDTSSSSASAAKSSSASRTQPPPPTPISIAEGTVLPLRLETGLSSATSRAGELVIARLAADVKVGERVVLKEGTELQGHVTEALPSGRVKGRAQLGFDFDHVIVGGHKLPVSVKDVEIEAASNKKHDAAVIGGGAGAGALIGAIANGGKGALVGTAVGAAAGTGVVLATKGKEVELPAGTGYSVRLDRPLLLPS